jgi:hypothetical protein
MLKYKINKGGVRGTVSKKKDRKEDTIRTLEMQGKVAIHFLYSFPVSLSFYFSLAVILVGKQRLLTE